MCLLSNFSLPMPRPSVSYLLNLVYSCFFFGCASQINYWKFIEAIALLITPRGAVLIKKQRGTKAFLTRRGKTQR